MSCLLRIHHIISNYSQFTGGAPRIVRSLHLGLRASGVDSRLLGLMGQRDAPIEHAQTLGYASPYQPGALMGLSRYLKQQVSPSDLLHVHLFPPALYVSLLTMLGRFGSKIIYTEHSTSNRRRGKLLGSLLDRITYRAYDQIIAISPGVESALLAWKPGLTGKTKVVHNGVELAFDQPLIRKARTRLRVVSIGNLRQPKNYATALKAVAMLGDLDFEYQIAGVGELSKPLLELQTQLRLQDKVRFLGYVENVPELLKSSDIFLMPSLWEGFGLAAVEAMNASLPMVVSDIAGLGEIVNSDPACALLVDPHSTESIAAGLRQLIGSEVMRMRLSQSGFAQAEKYSLDKMISEYRKLYEQYH
jgi:glycosyltransferase involved in cell wall biosynthesis